MGLREQQDQQGLKDQQDQQDQQGLKDQQVPMVGV
jgi:hypothetical protein